MTRRPVSARVGAGIGKSRITAELEGRLHAELHIRLRYFCSPYHQDSALFPFVSDRSTKAVLEVMARGQRRFVHDSPLVEAVTSELVSETTISGLLECGWGLSDR
jgi:predicted ATPase